MRLLPIIILLAACTPNVEHRSLATATEGLSLVILECFGWCALAEGDGAGEASLDKPQAEAPFE